MTQTVVENAVLCLISEPAGIPNSNRWFSSENGLAAVYVGNAVAPDLIRLYKSSVRCVAVSLRKTILLSCYVSPNASLRDYRSFLDELTVIVASIQDQDIILAGDFNAHSSHWGCTSTSAKGELLENWAAGFDLRLANIGDTPTCVRWQGSSVIDLTWVSPSFVGRVSNWRIREEIESLSDHRYISYSVDYGTVPSRGRIHGPCWNTRKLDGEMLLDSIKWSCAVKHYEEESDGINPMDR